MDARWRALFQRHPLGEKLGMVADVGNARRLFAPVKHRAAYIYCDVPAAALVAGGLFYSPPPGGAVVTAVHFGTGGGASEGRSGLIDLATWNAATWGVIGGMTIEPLWPDRPLRGDAQPIQAMGIGDLARSALPSSRDCEVEVMPGNVFVLALTAANIIAECAILVHEFIGDDDLNT